jgi:hypothetical protein
MASPPKTVWVVFSEAPLPTMWIAWSPDPLASPREQECHALWRTEPQWSHLGLAPHARWLPDVEQPNLKRRADQPALAQLSPPRSVAPASNSACITHFRSLPGSCGNVQDSGTAGRLSWPPPLGTPCRRRRAAEHHPRPCAAKPQPN